jgi:hypothetical protein
LDKYSNLDGKLPIEITIRAAGPDGVDRKVDLKLYTADDDKLVDHQPVFVPGDGYQIFSDATWSGIELDSYKKNLRLYIHFTGKCVRTDTISIHKLMYH